MPPVLPTETIPHLKTAALRDFNPAYVACGSSDRSDRARHSSRLISSMPVSLEHNGQIGRLERFSRPSGVDSKPLPEAVGGKDKKSSGPAPSAAPTVLPPVC